MATTDIPEKVQKALQLLPEKPGVYIMRNADAEVIYVGKATRLKDRVRSYFGSARSLEPKTRALRAQIADLEYIVLTSPAEALLLEATLIKRHQPFYNIRLKDDKRYPYLRIDIQHPWPRVTIVRQVKKDGARYFGPYASSGSVRATLDLIKKLFPWRSCTKEITGNDPRPCLDYYIKRCIAPCASYCTKEEYDEVIEQVVMFLEGRVDDVLDRLREQMTQAAEVFDYERAATLRDQIRAVEQTVERQSVATVRDESLDVFGLARNGDRACVQVYFIRGGRMIGRDSFMLDGVDGEPEGVVLGSFLQQYYESAQAIPGLVCVPIEVADHDDLEQMLTARREANAEIRLPQRGEKRRLVELAAENASESLDLLTAKWQVDQSKTEQALEQLREELALPHIPRRIECYDNSNIQGAHPVSSMVVFVDGKPETKQYRRFKVKTVEGPDDFATMQEVLRRRFRHLAPAAGDPEAAEAAHDVWDRPDLVIVDGGKGQVSAAALVMRELDVYDIPLVGLAKRYEELFFPGEPDPVVLPRGSEALFLVQQLRDEAHRFAITYHRKVRARAATQSALDTVPGIGPKRKKALIQKFGSVRKVREASIDEIAATVGFTRALAERVKEHI